MLTVRRLVWDAWNVMHIARHGVSPEEVEEVCHGNYQAEKGYKGRIRLVGPSSAGRMLAIILAPKGADIYYPVTARPAGRKERRLYEKKREGDKND